MSGARDNFPDQDDVSSLGNSRHTSSIGSSSQTNGTVARNTPAIATVQKGTIRSGKVQFNNASSGSSTNMVAPASGYSTNMVSAGASTHSSVGSLPQFGFKHGGPNYNSSIGATPQSKSFVFSIPTPGAVAASSYNDIMMGDSSQVSILTSVSKKLLPSKRNKIDHNWATQNWQFANHLKKDLPLDNPSPRDVQDYCNELMKMWNSVYNNLQDNLLGQLQVLFRKHFISSSESRQPPKKIQAIHNHVLKSSSKCDDEYLARVLEFFKGPQKFDREWIHLTVRTIEQQYKIKFPVCKDKNFIEAIADDCFNDTHNQRFRRGMREAVGAVWYDRLPPVNNFPFKEFETDFEKKEIIVCNKLYKGNLVRKVGAKAQEESKELECSPSNDFERICKNTHSEEDFIAEMRNLYRRREQKSLTQESENDLRGFKCDDLQQKLEENSENDQGGFDGDASPQFQVDEAHAVMGEDDVSRGGSFVIEKVKNDEDEKMV